MNRRVLAIVIAVSALITSACGDDDDEAATPAPVDEATEEPAGDVSAFCTTLNDLFNAADEDLGVDTETASEDEIIAASAEFFASDRGESLMEQALEQAPPGLQTDLQTVIDAAQEFGQTGDTAALEADEVAAADEAVQAFEEENCPSEE